MAVSNFRKKVGGLSSNFKIYINAIETGLADPTYIADAENIAREVRPYAKDYPEFQKLLDQFDTTLKEWGPAYEGLSPNQRPAELWKNGSTSTNIYQQAVDSGKTPAEVAREGLTARMAGEEFTPYTNQYIDQAKTLQSQGKSPEEIRSALQAQGATGEQITSTFSDLGVSFAGPTGSQGKKTPGASGGTYPGTDIPLEKTHQIGDQIYTASGFNATQPSGPSDQLVRMALMKDVTQDLQNQEFWNKQPDDVRQEAYSKLQQIMQDPKQLADYVKSQNFQNLQKFSWWDQNPNKQAAWDIMQQGPQQGPQQGGSLPGNGGAPTTQGTTQGTTQPTTQDGTMEGGATGSATPTLDSQSGTVAAQAILKQYLDNGMIDQGTYDLFNQAAGMWNAGTELNMKNVMDTFNQISETTIDPYFKEQASIFKDDISRNLGHTQEGRGFELEAETTTAAENIRGAKGNLEARGLTFSGEGGRLLGSQSAYGQTQQGVIPGQKFGEGLVEQQNRLTASSTAARYKQNLESLARSAETTLGTEGSSGMVPGIKQIGGVTGTMPYQEQQAKAQTLGTLYKQEQANSGYRKDVQLFK